MHNRAEARYRNVVAEVVADLQRAIDRALAAGVAWDHVVVDPGFGFGKTPDHNLALLRDLARARASLGRPVLLGTSRKSTLGKVLDLPAGPAASRRRWPRPRSGSRPASTSFASTTCARTSASRAMTDAIVRAAGGRPGRLGGDPVTRPHPDRGHGASRARHGVHEHEQRQPQPFEVDVELVARPAAGRPRPTTSR